MSKKFLMGSAAASLIMAGVCFAAPSDGSGGGDDRTAKIRAGLGKLDTSKDEDWTEGGLPSLGRMQTVTGLGDLKRAEVGEAAPGFSRTNANAAPSDLSKSTASPSGDDEPDAALNGGEGSGDEEPKSELDEANERRAPNLDPRDNPNVGKDDLGPYEGQTHTADQEQYLAEELAAEDMEPTAIAGKYKDPIALIEAAYAAFNADPRYAKNGELNQFFRHYSIAQVNIKTHQARLNKRFDQQEAAS